MAIFNSYVKLPEGISAIFRLRSYHDSARSMTEKNSPRCFGTFCHTLPIITVRSSVLQQSIMYIYIYTILYIYICMYILHIYV